MIIDELIAVIFSFFGMLLEAMSGLFVLIINSFAFLIEVIMTFFITDFSLGRAKKYQRNKASGNELEGSLPRHVMPVLFVVTVVSMISYQSFMKRSITFVADDGHSLPFASVVIYQGDEMLHKRTKNDGSLEMARFGIDKIVINDKRYKKQSWQGDDIEDILIVKRSMLGRGVDALAKKLLLKIKD